MLARARFPARGVAIATLAILAVAVGFGCCAGGEQVPVVDPGDDGSGNGSGADGQTSTGDPGGQGVPGLPGEDDGPDGTGGTGNGEAYASPVETLPPKGDDPFIPFATDNPLFILALLMAIGAMAAYVPGEVRRIRIETAHRESMDGKLALARGEFSVALTAFDRAIEQAHQAYTRKHSVSSPAQWVLMPDKFYIGLWRGRAAALMGLGRRKSAVATARMADELEAAVNNGNE